MKTQNRQAAFPVIQVSLGITALLTAIGYRLIGYIMKVSPLDRPFRWIVENIGSAPVMAVAGLVVFFLSYRLLRKRFPNGQNPDEEANRALKESKYRLFRTIRWKFMFVFLLSLAVTVGLVITGHWLISTLIGHSAFQAPLAWIVNHIGSVPIMALTGCMLFLIVFFLTSREMIRYLEEITGGLKEIAKGQFDVVLPVRSSDELGMLAYNINQMSSQVKQSIEEERNAEKTKNDLITGMSHDLRTPLTSILGFLELVENDRYQDEEELRHFVSIAYEKSLGVKRLIDDLFDYTRISGGMPLNKVKLDMTDFLRQLAEEFVPSLEKAGMECRIHAEEKDLIVFADGDLLARAYENLISNAIRYGRDGKFIDIRVKGMGDEVVTEIVNYGDSIPNKDLPYLFDRFYRVDESRSKHTGGTGLGLAIAKSIVEAHGGHIEVASSSAETAFLTRLPTHAEVPFRKR
ncbi:HAMP domain-containing sensor histidine kinase [Gorillibacterium sp. CAU 1737]|uniref:HAMP domain-containing sensor histidine kinase n=1 Tax=Gorillibacterium sp. CAU 1737 TaxID=3140362 RepID=UPI00326025B4